MEYTREYILNRCNEAIQDPVTFYKAPFVNYTGTTPDGEYYTEIVSRFLLNYIDDLKKIEKHTRHNTYNMPRIGNYNKSSQDSKKGIAIKMFNDSKIDQPYDYIGKVIHYQTPLKDVMSDRLGKIDILSVSGEKLYIIDLKKKGSHDTMLSGILKAYTYKQIIDMNKLLRDFDLNHSKHTLNAATLTCRSDKQHHEMQEKRPYMHELKYQLGVSSFYYSQIPKTDKYTIYTN